MTLTAYKRKRDFKKTAEPEGKQAAGKPKYRYMIHKHDASRLHYDLRLELDGTMKSWAVPKGPSLNPSEKRLAVHVEDHPIEYTKFEGTIPKGQYGGGTVMIWDRGRWEPLDADPRRAYREGKMKFLIHGEKLTGAWALVRMRARGSAKDDNWLLIKERDEVARADGDITEEAPDSISTGRTLDEIAGTNAPSQPQPRKSHVKARSKAAVRKSKKSQSELPSEAMRAPMPESVKPQLCTLVKTPPTGDGWIHETKFDGYRIVAFLKGGHVRLMTRNDNAVTAKFPSVAAACERLGRDCILDGEIVVPRADGTTDFQALQNMLRSADKVPVLYYVFDLLYLDGRDLSRVPLLERKKLLLGILPKASESGVIRFSEHIEGQGEAVFENACKLSLEGIVSKRVDSTYVFGRSSNWMKIKCNKGQEFVIGGYTDPGGSRAHFGALLLGYYDSGGELKFAGKVGTGFTQSSLKVVFKELRKHGQKASPFKSLPEDLEVEGVHWLKPVLVAEVAFSEWTRDAQLRHPSFKGLRDDKRAKDIVRESPKPAGTASGAEKVAPPRATKRHAKAAAEATGFAGVTITHPDRLLYPEGITKEALAVYYDAVAERMLPHIAKRPLMLMRCPQGQGQKCFFQKHLGEITLDAVRSVPIEEKSGVQQYIVIDDKRGLLQLVNLGVLEFHTWGCHDGNIERPDILVFDLDPDPAVSHERLVDAVARVRERLSALGVDSFVKTTGGKGFHVVAPMQKRLSWDEHKAFAKAFAEEIAGEDPAHFIATMSKAKRRGKIFIDYLRNGRGATFVAPYSTRAREHAPVAMPLAWKELPETSPSDWTIQNATARLKKQDPWRGFVDLKNSLRRGRSKKA